MRLPIQPKTVKPKVNTIANIIQNRFMLIPSLFQSFKVTSTGTWSNCSAAPSPPNPAPTIATCGVLLMIPFSRFELGYAFFGLTHGPFLMSPKTLTQHPLQDLAGAALGEVGF